MNHGLNSDGLHVVVPAIGMHTEPYLVAAICELEALQENCRKQEALASAAVEQ